MSSRPSILFRLVAPAIFAASVACALGGGAGACFAQYRTDLPPDSTPMKNVPNPTITPHPNALVPEDLTFTTSEGKSIKLGDLFHKTGASGVQKPVILSLVYFSCPMLCGLNQESLAATIQQGPRSLQLGKDYDVVVVSIDPDDTPDIAAIKRKNYLARAEKPDSQEGFTYLTGTEQNIRQLADAVGFGYHKNDGIGADKYAHSLGLFILTSSAHVSQTLINADYTPDELHAALLQAADNKIGSGLLEKIALPCGAMRLNPRTGMYEHNPWFYAGTATGLASIAFMAIFLGILWKGEFKKKHDHHEPPPESPQPT